MSMKIYAMVLVKPGHDRFNAALGHDRAAADAFLQAIGHRRHVYRGDFGPDMYLEPDLDDLVIQANASGVVAFNIDLALDLSLGGRKAERAAALGPRLLATAYNDQCLTDYVSYYEDGALRRRIADSDGFDAVQVVLEGGLLPEEVEALRESSPHPDCEPDELTGFEVDGHTYYVEGRLPLYGAGLAVSRRFVDEGFENSYPRVGSLYAPKPWWKFW